MKFVAKCRKHPDHQVLFLESTVRGTIDGQHIRDLDNEITDTLYIDANNLYCSSNDDFNHDTYVEVTEDD